MSLEHDGLKILSTKSSGTPAGHECSPLKNTAQEQWHTAVNSRATRDGSGRPRARAVRSARVVRRRAVPSGLRQARRQPLRGRPGLSPAGTLLGRDFYENPPPLRGGGVCASLVSRVSLRFTRGYSPLPLRGMSGRDGGSVIDACGTHSTRSRCVRDVSYS